MTLNRALVVAAVVCFAVAFLTAVGAVSSNEAAWQAGGLLAFAASFAL